MIRGRGREGEGGRGSDDHIAVEFVSSFEAFRGWVLTMTKGRRGVRNVVPGSVTRGWFPPKVWLTGDGESGVQKIAPPITLYAGEVERDRSGTRRGVISLGVHIVRSPELRPDERGVGVCCLEA